MAEKDARLPALTAQEIERVSAFLYVLGCLFLASLAAFMPMRMSVYAHDALIQLEGAWRIHQGLRIHEGVHTPMGALYPYLLALGIQFVGPLPQAFLVPALLPLPLLAWLSWLVFRPRFGPKTTVLVSLLMVAILVGPTCLGDPVDFLNNWTRTTFGMQYNRTIWPFASLLAILALVPPRLPREKRERRIEALIAGLLLAICFFGKVNYFVGGVLVIGVGWWRTRHQLGTASLGLISFVAVVLVFVALNVPMRAYLSDLIVLGRAQSAADRAKQVFVLIGVNLEYVLTVAALWFANRKSPDRWLMNMSVLLVVFGVLVASANYQERMIPTMLLALFVLAEHVRRQPQPHRILRRISGNLAAVFGAGWIATTIASFVPAYALLPQLTGSGWPGITTYAHSGFYRSAIVPAGSDAQPVVESTDRQARACDRLFGKSAVVYHMGWYNVMPVLREAPSPRGLLWYHGGRTVTRETLPPPDRELAGVDGIVWPRIVDREDTLIVEAYRSYVTQYFVPLDADDTASYWRRR